MVSLILCLTAVLTGLAGCSERWPWPSKTHDSLSVRTRNTPEAVRLNERGLEALDAERWEEAARYLDDAVEADSFYGPAHNNLGVAYLHLKRYYQAAWAFRHASKLMPQAVSPYNNLGLVYEAVGLQEKALKSFEQAFEIDPNDVVTIGHLARSYVKLKEHSPELRGLLEQLALRADSSEWSTWAQEQIIKYYGE